jgi:hypothetical protein
MSIGENFPEGSRNCELGDSTRISYHNLLLIYPIMGQEMVGSRFEYIFPQFFRA